MNPLQRLELVDEIAVELQSRYSTTDINALLMSLGVKDNGRFTDMAGSKRVYAKQLLPDLSDAKLAELALHLGIQAGPTDSHGPATTALQAAIADRNLGSIQIEVDRALASVEADPEATLTAACAIIEATCKAYIIENELPIPKKQTIQPLWTVVKKDLGLVPERIEDDDIKVILGGISSTIHGLGALRTHASSAHGRAPLRYKVRPRHARLAMNAAHTLVVFIIETWRERTEQEAK